MSNAQKPGTAAQQGRVWFPFSDQTNWQPSVPTPWLGGMIVPLLPSTGITTHANPNFAVAHGLNRKPRFCQVLDAWTNANITQPIPRSTVSTGWNSQNAYFNMPSFAAPIILFFA